MGKWLKNEFRRLYRALLCVVEWKTMVGTAAEYALAEQFALLIGKDFTMKIARSAFYLFVETQGFAIFCLFTN